MILYNNKYMDNNFPTEIDITIIIPAYNEEKNLAETINSIRSQITNFSYDIIVIDNASTDKTSAIAKKMGVKTIYIAKKGLFYARQSGLHHVKTEFVVYVDADTKLSTLWLQKTTEYLKKHPEAVAVSSNYDFYDANLILKIIFFLSQYVIAPVVLVILRIFNKPDLFIGTAFAARTAILKQMGGFREDFPFYGEDIALAYRLAKKGKVRFLPSLFIYTSSRRYRSVGFFKTLYYYYMTSLYLVMGRTDKASLFSKKHSK